LLLHAPGVAHRQCFRLSRFQDICKKAVYLSFLLFFVLVPFKRYIKEIKDHFMGAD
jgi:hypothetical protein